MGKIKEGLYRCVCGREFSKAQSYNAHLSHCKENLGEERYEKRIQLQIQCSKKANEVQSKLKEQVRIEKYKLAKREWELTDHYCEKCGKLLPKVYEDVYGNGRYCNKSCANSRVHSMETLRMIALNSNIKGKASRSLNGHYKGYYCASSYELIYLVYCLDHNINIERNTHTFIYNYEGKDHVYSPDWYLPDTNTIIECKGRNYLHYNEELVTLKAKSVDKSFNYRILYEEDLKEY